MDTNYQRKLRSPTRSPQSHRTHNSNDSPQNNRVTPNNSPWVKHYSTITNSPSTTSLSFSASPLRTVNYSPSTSNTSPSPSSSSSNTTKTLGNHRKSPCKARRKLSDRFIPIRTSSEDISSSNIIVDENMTSYYNNNNTTKNNITNSSFHSPPRETSNTNYIDNSNQNNNNNNNNNINNINNNDIYGNILTREVLTSPKRRLRFNDDGQQYYSPQYRSNGSFTNSRKGFSPNNHKNSPHYTHSDYYQRPPRPQSQRIKPMRTIPTEPRKVLDAPCMSDDYYLNLLDWGSTNIIAVGLRNDVFLYNATTSKVSPLCHFESDSIETDMVTSVCWMPSGTQLAVGTHHGTIEIWDVTQEELVRVFNQGHNGRISSLASHGNCLASGSKDKRAIVRDLREPQVQPEPLYGHSQEVCGLRWSLNGKHLASGGNDNRAFVWSPGNSIDPLMEIKEHQAAVKAIAWSPHHHGYLATGGGSADQTIRLWDVNRCCESSIHHVNTGSQVCNLTWATTVNELISAHGYSQYQIMLWEPNLKPLATLTGHSMRVLHLTLSPDGQTIASGAADETIRLWHAFPPEKAKLNASRRRTSAMITDIR